MPYSGAFFDTCFTCMSSKTGTSGRSDPNTVMWHEHHDSSNHQQVNCLVKNSFRSNIKENIKAISIAGIFWWESISDSWIPLGTSSCHHDKDQLCSSFTLICKHNIVTHETMAFLLVYMSSPCKYMYIIYVHNCDDAFLMFGQLHCLASYDGCTVISMNSIFIRSLLT